MSLSWLVVSNSSSIPSQAEPDCVYIYIYPIDKGGWVHLRLAASVSTSAVLWDVGCIQLVKQTYNIPGWPEFSAAWIGYVWKLESANIGWANINTCQTGLMSLKCHSSIVNTCRMSSANNNLKKKTTSLRPHHRWWFVRGMIPIIGRTFQVSELCTVLWYIMNLILYPVTDKNIYIYM